MATKRRRKTSSRRKNRRVSGDPSLAPAVVSGTRRRRSKSKAVARKRRKRSRGMGAITGSDSGDMLLGLGLGVGTAIVARIAGKKFLPGKEKIIAGANALIGAAAVIKGKKPMLKGFGMGMAAIGVYQSSQEFGLISGMEEFIHGIGANEKDTMLIEMNGVDLNSTNIIQGTDMPLPSIVSGDEMSGDEMSGDEGYASGMPSVVG